MRFLTAVFAVLLAVPLAAQDPTGPEDYVIDTTLGQANRINLGRRVHNEQQCNAAGLPLDCTQAQLDAEPSHQATIYPNTQEGRRLFIKFEWAANDFAQVLEKERGWSQQRARINWCAASRADKDAVCTSAAIGRPAGCELYECNN